MARQLGLELNFHQCFEAFVKIETTGMGLYLIQNETLNKKGVLINSFIKYMQISNEQVQEFKELFRKEYGKELNDQEAYEAASNLLGFFELLLRIDERGKSE